MPAWTSPRPPSNTSTSKTTSRLYRTPPRVRPLDPTPARRPRLAPDLRSHRWLRTRRGRRAPRRPTARQCRHPAQVRHFALAQAALRNDPLDAAVLTAYGQAFKPASTPMADADLAETARKLIQWHRSTQGTSRAPRQYSEHATLGFAQRQQAGWSNTWNSKSPPWKKELARGRAGPRPARSQDQVHALAQLDGVGTLTAVSVAQSDARNWATSTSQQTTAALASLAPWTNKAAPGKANATSAADAPSSAALYARRRGTLARQTKATNGTIFTNACAWRQTGQRSRPDRRHAQTAPPNGSKHSVPIRPGTA